MITIGRSPKTSFNATIDSKRYYGLEIGGRPNLKSGMIVTAALERPNDWYSLAGWMNHESRQVEGIAAPELFLFFAVVILVAAAMILPGLSEQGDLTPKSQMFIAAFLVVAAAMAVDSKKAWAIRKQLRISDARDADNCP